jgi:hypothetical protein
MVRIGGSDGMPKARKSLIIAVIAATTALTASAFADTPAAATSTPHKAKHSATASSSKSSSTKTAKTTPLPGDCGPTPDQASIGIRALQTELMVAGLKCSAEQWNSFTAKFKATIKTDADRMQKVFSRPMAKAALIR